MQVELSPETESAVNEYIEKVYSRLGFKPSVTTVVNKMAKEGIRSNKYEIDEASMRPLKSFKKK